MKLFYDFHIHSCLSPCGDNEMTPFNLVNAAKLFGATGWVRNEYDGSVTMEIQGTRFQISQVLNELERDRYIRIERTESKDVPIEAKEKKFRVAYF